MSTINSATFAGSEQKGQTQYRVRAIINGSTEQWFTASGTTLQQVADSVSNQIADINDGDATKNVLAGIAIGTVIPITRPAAVTDPDATWLSQVAQLTRVKAIRDAVIAHGATPPAQLDTDFDALVTAVKTGYTTTRGGKL